MSQVTPEPTPEAAEAVTNEAAEQLNPEAEAETLTPEAVPESTLLERWTLLEQKIDSLIGNDPEELVLTTPAATQTVTQTEPDNLEVTQEQQPEPNNRSENPDGHVEAGTSQNQKPRRRGLFGRG